MNCLFVNGYGEQACGVVAYGKSLYDNLKDSTNIRWNYCEPPTPGALRAMSTMPTPDVTVFNYQSGQGGFLADAPFPFLKKQVLVFHDCQVDEARWDAILFSDPTMNPRGKWHKIGRPIPQYKPKGLHPINPELPRPIVGVHGFIGAWADQVVHRVMQEFETATVTLSLPFAKYSDSTGAAAMAMADRCRNMVAGSGIRLFVSHDFKPQWELVEWLHSNDLNCYIRPPEMNWRGVSSAPDCALAARRPLAINKCSSFRHLHHLSPSICVEDFSLMEIIGNGLSPLVKLYSDWSPENIRQDVEKVLFGLNG